MPSTLSNLLILASTSFYAKSQRHLLQLPNPLVPIPTSQFCYPTGRCDLGLISDGSSGFVLQGEAADDRSGYSVSTAGDINGDGLSDIIVGALYASSYAGKSYVIFGSNNSAAWGNGFLNLSSLINSQRGFVLQGAVNDRSGASVSTAGDINGDGISDIIVGASEAASNGKSYVVFGSSNSAAWGNGTLSLGSLINGQSGFVLQGAAGDYNSGYSVSTAGDINGDGISDIIIGAPYASSQVGKSYVVFGSSNSSAWGNGLLNLSSLINGQRGFVLQGETVSDQSGSAVSTAGDINGDGISDIIVGAPDASSYTGKSYVVFGSNKSTAWGNGVLNLSSLINGQRGFVLQGETVNDQSGSSVSTAGDINGDGLSDIIVAAPYASYRTGKSYVVFGSNNSTAWGNGVFSLSSLMDGQRGFVLQGAVGDYSGSSISAAGDVNGDGISDIIVGAPYVSNGAGKSYVIFGSNSSSAWGNGTLSLENLINDHGAFLLQGEMANDYSGCSVSAAGDINGDGVSDIIMGSYNALSGAGRSYVMFRASSLYVAHNSLEISVGETVVLTPQMLALGANSPGLDISGLILTVETAANGYFALKSAPFVSITNFYSANISAGLIQFTHTGEALAPQYRISVQFRTAKVFSEAEINFLGYPPKLIANHLIINQGQSIVLDPTILAVSDPDNAATALRFTISDLVHGQFRLYDASTNMSIPSSQFSQEDILNRKVLFEHDGSANIPSYLVAVTDGRLRANDSNQTAKITFNHAPEMSIKTSLLILDQGQGTRLSPLDISAIDVETFVDRLIISADNVTYGYFAFANNPAVAIKAFQQLPLSTGAIQFVQNGSDATPTFALRVYDGKLYSPWQNPQVYLNHRPKVKGSIADKIVTQGDDFSFTISENIFNDPDINDTLRYSASLTGGAPLPVGVTYTAPQQFTGNLPNTGNFNIEVQAKDNRGLIASTNFILTAQESKAAYYRSVYGSLSGIAGSGVAILAYLWLRKRIARHRRDFAFANDLRKTLNLEYYDFTRFDGDTFKTRVNDFLRELQSEHQQFYTKLSAEEQKSFAVCVAEILIARELVSRSGQFGGLFGVLCCLNVGWPSQLDMKAFEAQGPEITVEAVATWKQHADYKLAELSEEGIKENNTIYIEITDNVIHYTVKDVGVKRGGEQGEIKASQLGLAELPTTVDALNPYLPKILEITLEHGHTKADKALKKWPYHSPSLKEKASVFFCCAKPSSAGMFAPKRKNPGIELQELAVREDGTHEAQSPIYEGKVAFFAGKAKKIDQQFNEINEKFTTVNEELDKLSEQMRALEENKPLLAC